MAEKSAANASGRISCLDQFCCCFLWCCGYQCCCCPCFQGKEKKPLLSKDEDMQEMEYHLTHAGSSGGSLSDVSEPMDQADLDKSIKEQPHVAGGHHLTSGATPQSSDYGSVAESDKGSRRSYKLHMSEGLSPVVQIREQTS